MPAGQGRARPWGLTLLTAAIACFVTFYAKGGLNLESMTVTEMALTCAAGAAVAVAVLLAPRDRRSYGLWPTGLLLAFAALSALSVVWSVQPDDSWKDAGRMLAYAGVFGAAVALVRLGPGRSSSILGGLALATVIVCGYALLTKVFPGEIVPASAYARLDEPYGYWNAIGLTAAMGAICCIWLGSRRGGHALLGALAYPAMGVMLLTLLLAYSRGALAALAVGLALWFCVVPLRLRGASVLILGALGAGAVAAWDFSTHALSGEGVALSQRATAGHRLGALLAAMIVLLTLAGLAIGFFTGRRAPTPAARRRAGTLLLGSIVIAAVAFAGALAHSHRGFTGSVSHAVDSLTNPNAKPPPNTPGRLTAVASVRARYWKEALEIFEAHPAFGAGASGYDTGRLRYRTETLEVRHAHGFLVQTLADLGLAGLAVALALLLTWMAAAGRCTHPFDREWTSWREIRTGAAPRWRWAPRPYTPERVGLLTMLCLVVVFGVHSLVDWTWYVPGDACAALLCAGWLAGRGPLQAPAAGQAARRRAQLPRPGRLRLAVAAAVVLAALLSAWSQWQPQRSVDASQEALALLAHDPRAALAAAKTGVDRDPVSAYALTILAGVQRAAGDGALAQATLQRAVRLQPSNPETWLHLGMYDLTRSPRAALSDLEAAIYLDPESIAPELISGPRPKPRAIEIQNAYIQASRAVAAQSAVSSASAAPARAAAGAHRAARRRPAPRSLESESPRAVP
jgi:O-antigen ligase